MIYNIDVEVNEFQDSIIKKYATGNSVSPEELLVTYFNNTVKSKIDQLITDKLTDKIQEHGVGKVVAFIKAME